MELKIPPINYGHITVYNPPPQHSHPSYHTPCTNTRPYTPPTCVASHCELWQTLVIGQSRVVWSDEGVEGLSLGGTQKMWQRHPVPIETNTAWTSSSVTVYKDNNRHMIKLVQIGISYIQSCWTGSINLKCACLNYLSMMFKLALANASRHVFASL